MLLVLETEQTTVRIAIFNLRMAWSQNLILRLKYGTSYKIAWKNGTLYRLDQGENYTKIYQNCIDH